MNDRVHPIVGALDDNVAEDFDPFAGGEVERVVPTTEAQREVWLADQLGRDASLAYNESASLHFRGPLDREAMQIALVAMVTRHEALRATIGPDGGELLIGAEPRLPLEFLDLRGLAPADATTRVEAVRQLAVETPFDLGQGPLIRATLVSTGDAAHELVLTAHHVVCDGWSLGVLAHDLMQLYRAALDDAPTTLAPAPSFAEHALADGSAEMRAQREADERYWLAVHQGGGTPLDLPCDRARPAGTRSFASRREDLLLDPTLAKAVRALSARLGCSLFATLFGTYAALLARLSGSTDLTIGVPAAGQAAAGLDGLVGHCINLLPVRLQLDLDAAAAPLLAAARSAVLDAYEHQQCTLGSLLQKLQLPRDPSRLPLVSVMFNLDSAIPESSLSDPTLSVRVRGNPRSFENYELFLNVSQIDDTLQLECQYNTGLFDAATVQRWLGLYVEALNRLVADEAQPLAQLLAPTLTERALLAQFNASEAEHDRTQRVDALIAAQAAATPEAIAVVSGERRISYRVLMQRADALAAALRQHGVGPGELVGISCSRSEHMLVALVGVLRAGAGYVPLDPSFPAERLDFMSRDAKLRFVATDAGVEGDWKFPAAQPIAVDALAPVEAPVAPVSGRVDDVAYVIYTSGSTGQPKGVRVPHRSVVNFLHAMRARPGLQATDRLVAVTTLSFDIAVLELLLPLSSGATIVLASRDETVDGHALRALIDAQAATVMQATPSTWRLLIDAGWRGGPAFKALVGGEALPADLARALLDRCGELWNMYGPTETTVWSSCGRVHAPELGIDIGTPIANTRFDVVDAQMRLLPLGAVGELLIAGEGVTLGYLDRPELSADRFIADPVGAPGALRYRTGDLGRWCNDGTLECLGRIDHQIKLRGYRIELGDIEGNLATHPQVQRALAVTREFAAGDVRLVAYVVPQGEAPDAAELRRHLAALLPDYMVPQHFVVIDRIPLLPNGKIDRRALPAPQAVGAAAPRPSRARTPLQQLVAETMEKVLALPGLGDDDNFFQLGGHSLLATQLANALGRAAGLRVPLRVIFEAPTVAQLTAWIEARGAEAAAAAAPAPLATQPAAEAVADEATAPLSLMQQRLWFLDQLEPGRVVYNTPSAHRLTGPLDRAALERSFNTMIERQPILRTALVAGTDGEPVQQIEPRLAITLPIVEDFSALPPAAREEALLARMKALVAEPISLGTAPLFRHALYKLADDEHVLFFMPHHAIWDGWSFDLFYEEMAQLYGAYAAGTTPSLPPLATSYAAFARGQQQWLQSAELNEQLLHWKQRLADLPEPLALPADRSRPARASGEGSTQWVSCPKALADAARQFGREADATLYMTLLAAYALLLSRLSGQHDLVIGTPVRGRNASELEKVMGFFVNALPLRLRMSPESSFRDLVAQVRETVLDAFSAPDVPFEHLVRALNVPRDESRSPIYQAFFSFQDARQRIRRWGALQQEQVLLFQPGTAEDLGLWFLEHDGGLTGGLTYSTDLFDAGTAERLGERFGVLLGAALASPDRRIDELDLATPAERALVERASLGPALALPAAATVTTLIDAQVQRTPQADAVVGFDETLSYDELDRRAWQLAHVLRARGIGRGALVGLCLARTPSMLVAQLAVLRAGAAYVPLDPAYPSQRLEDMAQDAGLALLLSDADSLQSLSWPRQQTLLLDIDAGSIARQPETPLPPDAALDARPEDPAYVIYTSGSTGRPKGVVLPHRAVVNFLLAMQREPGMREGDRIVAVTTLSFDIAVLELLLPLTVGATVVLASREDTGDGHALRALLESSEANLMQATPSTWRLLLDAGWPGREGFRALVGGEALPADLAAALLQRCASLWNMYGPTETTVWSSCWRVEAEAAAISIGRPIANTTIRVLDARQVPCPIGVAGEICIGGSGVADGYLKRPELTAERFVDDPLAPGQRIYRTGDLGRWRADGLLEHLGRLDAQVKLREHLRAVLPEYMLPQHVIAIDTVPLLPNGNVASRQLPAIDGAAQASTGRDFAAPQSDAERTMAEIWQTLLGVPQVGRNDNFFDLGGHSLLAMRAVVEIERRLGVRLGVRRLIFETLAQVAALPQGDAPAGDAAPTATDAPEAPASGGWIGRVVKGLRG